MLARYSRRTRRTLEILVHAYCDGIFALEAEDIRQAIDHSQSFFRALPRRMRLAVIVTLRLFELYALFIGPLLRPLSKKEPADQRRVYEAWFRPAGYLRALLGQLLHLTFIGSVYSLPVVQLQIGYQRVSALR